MTWKALQTIHDLLLVAPPGTVGDGQQKRDQKTLPAMM
jgi:hypothetical protein